MLGQKADVCLPLSVIIELGKLQKSRAYDMAYTANDALDIIEELRADHDKFNGGVKIKNTNHILFVSTPLKYADIYHAHVDGKSSIHAQIIGIGADLQRTYRKVVLISKDKALRLLAAASNIDAEDYKNDMVQCYQGIEKVDDMLAVDQLTETQKIANRIFLCQNSDQNIQFYRDGQLEFIQRRHIKGFDIKPKNNEQVAAFWALFDPSIKFVSLQGKAGAGKTLLSLFAGIKQVLDDNNSYEKIIITRAMVPIDGEDLGALPGSAEEKISPYMDGVWDNLSIIQRSREGKNKTKEKDLKEYIEAIPFSLMRGKSISNTWVIIDEAQNISKHAMKMLLTRIDDSSKVIIMGDNDQIDHPFLDARSNGFVQAINLFKNHNQAAHITLYANERGKISEFASKM